MGKVFDFLGSLVNGCVTVFVTALCVIELLIVATLLILLCIPAIIYIFIMECLYRSEEMDKTQAKRLPHEKERTLS